MRFLDFEIYAHFDDEILRFDLKALNLQLYYCLSSANLAKEDEACFASVVFLTQLYPAYSCIFLYPHLTTLC